MNTKWMSWSLAVALGVATAAATALAQERPAPQPGDQPPGMEQEANGPAEPGGLDELMAADVGPGGPREGVRRGMGRGRGPGRGRGAAAMREKLNLTDDQKSRLADIRERHARRAVPIHGDLRIAALDLRKLMRADRPDQRAIDAQIDRIASLRASLQKSRIAGRLEARAVLTPAQQKIMREHRGGRMGPMGEHGPRMRRI
jgi:Spy/CpxP family protein refolding chaperone